MTQLPHDLGFFETAAEREFWPMHGVDEPAAESWSDLADFAELDTDGPAISAL